MYMCVCNNTGNLYDLPLPALVELISTFPESFSQTSWVVQKADSRRCRSEIVLNAEVSHSWDEVAAVPLA